MVEKEVIQISSGSDLDNMIESDKITAIVNLDTLNGDMCMYTDNNKNNAITHGPCATFQHHFKLDTYLLHRVICKQWLQLASE